MQLNLGGKTYYRARPPKPVLEASDIREILVSVKFLPAILGPEMATPILWAPEKIAFFLQENRRAHKIPRFGGGVIWVFEGRGEVPILFLWVRGFL